MFFADPMGAVVGKCASDEDLYPSERKYNIVQPCHDEVSCTVLNPSFFEEF